MIGELFDPIQFNLFSKDLDEWEGEEKITFISTLRSGEF